MPISIRSMRIPGSWKNGYVLDYHTESSDFLGHDEYGHPRFDTVRTDVGELLYRLKYGGKKEALKDLVDVSTEFIRKWDPPVEAIVPVPPSRVRASQPVLEFATKLAEAFKLPLHDVVRRKPTKKELKNVFEYHERIELLEDAHEVVGNSVRNRAVLLVDDLYRSGATLNAVTAALYKQGEVTGVFAFALTRTRSSS